MNLLKGEMRAGTFTGKNIAVSGLSKKINGPVTLGFRAEDAKIARKDANLVAPVYSMELLGEASQVTVQAGDALVAIRAAKDYRAAIGSTVTVHVPPALCHLFDAETGRRFEMGTMEKRS